ncbi:putative acyltransferase 3 domain-containing protein [Septoria linicola]|nr:putative acyltransferase 3 domain-containing protein [Septoria linicola]
MSVSVTRNDDGAMSSGVSSTHSTSLRYRALPLYSQVFRRIAYALVPTILRTRHEDLPRAAAITSTSWMDGLRGICAVLVVNFHFLFTFSPIAVLGYNSLGPVSQHITALPPLSFLWDGASSVNIFFIISGYVCSYKALQLMQDGPSNFGLLLQSLSSSVFRRGFRLYLPVLCMTLFTALLAHANGFALTDHFFAHQKIYFPGTNSEVNVPRFNTLQEQMGFWWQEMRTLTNIWESKPIYPDHDRHLWTIAYEYRMSLHVYVALLALARFEARYRLIALCALALTYTSWHRWEGPLFFLGAAGAQWDIMSRQNGLMHNEALTDCERLPYQVVGAKNEPQLFNHSTGRSRQARKLLLRVLTFGLALYLMGCSVDNHKHPGYGYTWINKFIPSWYRHRETKFPKSVGALILLYLLSSGPRNLHRGAWRTILESDIALYLGKIMFALYLVHGTVLHAVGYAIPHLVWTLVGGHDSSWKWMFGK